MLPKNLRWTAEGHAAGAAGVPIRDLTSEQIGVVYQPIVDARSGALFAHEVLVRCRVPELQSPLVLFDRAVEERACGRLGRLIRERATQSDWGVPLFLNIHPDELSERWLVRPDDPIGQYSGPVFLEITESAAFTHHDLCDSILREVCQRTGAQLVIDDFGAGHSNLNRLLELAPAIVKLDLALVRGVHDSAQKQAVVRHVTALCHELGARIVAEGVEVERELACVQELGVDFVQGYLLARPADPPPEVSWPIGPRASRAAARAKRSANPAAPVQRARRPPPPRKQR